MTHPAAVRVYEPPGIEPHEDIAVDLLADGRRRQVIRTEGAPVVAQHGTAEDVAPGATATVVSRTAEPGLTLTGFTFTGSGDATGRLLVDGIVVGLGDISVVSKTAPVTLPGPYSVPTGAVVTVAVFCRATGSADFEAVLYGEVVPT